MVLGGSCPGGNCPQGSCPMGVIVLGGSCPQGSCPQGSGPRSSCPRGSCPRTEISVSKELLNVELFYGRLSMQILPTAPGNFVLSYKPLILPLLWASCEDKKFR